MAKQDLKRYYLIKFGGTLVLFLAIPAILLGLCEVPDAFGYKMLAVLELALGTAAAFFAYRYRITPRGTVVEMWRPGVPSDEQATAQYLSRSRKAPLLCFAVSFAIMVADSQGWWVRIIQLTSINWAMLLLSLVGIVDPETFYALPVTEAPLLKRVLSLLVMLAGFAIGIFIVARCG